MPSEPRTPYPAFKFLPLATFALLLLLIPNPALGAISSEHTSVLPEETSNPMVFGVPISRHTSSSSEVGRHGYHPPEPHVYRPPQAPLDVQTYPVAPFGLELEQVHVYVRHGERTPVGIRLSHPPASIPEHWMMCKTARQFHTAVSGLTAEGEQDGFLRTRKVVERADGTVAEGECLLGELTDVGRQSTFNLGRSLRKLYVDKLGFLSDTLCRKEEVYFRSTNMPRTIESLQQIVHGLYPTEKCGCGEDVIPNILVRNGKDENMLGNTYACKRLEILQLGFAKAAATAYNPSLEHLDKRLSRYLDGNPIRVDGKPRASGIMDTVRAAIAHGIKVPPEFEDKAIVDVIERAVVNEWFAGCKIISYKTEEVRRLGMGRLLDDMTRKMQHKIDRGTKDPLKILVHSTHDTALAGLCSTLDVFDEQWPPFTASITFELFKKPDSEGDSPAHQSILSGFRKPIAEHFIRMRYQNTSMALPICAEKGNHLPGFPEFCTLTAFRNRVRELTPTDFEGECMPAGKS
ncbi:putative acid phosphatase SPBC4.06 [Hypsizygus marmoreus]|uniref:Acid phosphatase SPBC4.06 n=1 Tax=Hypsizygus marmoreus TaxID=39966 RepID=A0A369K6M7_HYPMA|nr:putative acid phosphatase SPBC4.06 [Hypsizygus marmoreus]